ncbi:hypothetical protein JKP88DRAFT_319003 [Tribonema minus]|uniref:RRM domain-containing protein n=1 Tax=Tribonema minus TaxID=303371 RepID=A0A836CEP5_9STRA|nr:hypothetical protein JKP88DRAFT_319003 [Tribonema minus]
MHSMQFTSPFLSSLNRRRGQDEVLDDALDVVANERGDIAALNMCVGIAEDRLANRAALHPTTEAFCRALTALAMASVPTDVCIRAAVALATLCRTAGGEPWMGAFLADTHARAAHPSVSPMMRTMLHGTLPQPGPQESRGGGGGAAARAPPPRRPPLPPLSTGSPPGMRMEPPRPSPRDALYKRKRSASPPDVPRFGRSATRARDAAVYRDERPPMRLPRPPQHAAGLARSPSRGSGSGAGYRDGGGGGYREDMRGMRPAHAAVSRSPLREGGGRLRSSERLQRDSDAGDRRGGGGGYHDDMRNGAHEGAGDGYTLRRVRGRSRDSQQDRLSADARGRSAEQHGHAADARSGHGGSASRGSTPRGGGGGDRHGDWSREGQGDADDARRREPAASAARPALPDPLWLPLQAWKDAALRAPGFIYYPNRSSLLTLAQHICWERGNLQRVLAALGVRASASANAPFEPDELDYVKAVLVEKAVAVLNHARAQHGDAAAPPPPPADGYADHNHGGGGTGMEAHRGAPHASSSARELELRAAALAAVDRRSAANGHARGAPGGGGNGGPDDHHYQQQQQQRDAEDRQHAAHAAAAAAAAAQQQPVDLDGGSTWKPVVAVLGLPLAAEAGDVADFFAEHCGGTVRPVSIKLVAGHDGHSRVALVSLFSVQQAERASTEMDGAIFAMTRRLVNVVYVSNYGPSPVLGLGSDGAVRHTRATMHERRGKGAKRMGAALVAGAITERFGAAVADTAQFKHSSTYTLCSVSFKDEAEAARALVDLLREYQHPHAINRVNGSGRIYVALGGCPVRAQFLPFSRAPRSQPSSGSSAGAAAGATELIDERHRGPPPPLEAPGARAPPPPPQLRSPPGALGLRLGAPPQHEEMSPRGHDGGGGGGYGVDGGGGGGYGVDGGGGGGSAARAGGRDSTPRLGDAPPRRHLGEQQQRSPTPQSGGREGRGERGGRGGFRGALDSAEGGPVGFNLANVHGPPPPPPPPPSQVPPPLAEDVKAGMVSVVQRLGAKQEEQQLSARKPVQMVSKGVQVSLGGHGGLYSISSAAKIEPEEAMRRQLSYLRVLDLEKRIMGVCKRIGSFNFIGRDRKKHVMDVRFESPREALVALEDVDALGLVSCIKGRPCNTLLKARDCEDAVFSFQGGDDSGGGGGGGGAACEGGGGCDAATSGEKASHEAPAKGQRSASAASGKKRARSGSDDDAKDVPGAKSEKKARASKMEVKSELMLVKAEKPASRGSSSGRGAAVKTEDDNEGQGERKKHRSGSSSSGSRRPSAAGAEPASTSTHKERRSSDKHSSKHARAVHAPGPVAGAVVAAAEQQSAAAPRSQRAAAASSRAAADAPSPSPPQPQRSSGAAASRPASADSHSKALHAKASAEHGDSVADGSREGSGGGGGGGSSSGGGSGGSGGGGAANTSAAGTPRSNGLRGSDNIDKPVRESSADRAGMRKAAAAAALAEAAAVLARRARDGRADTISKDKSSDQGGISGGRRGDSGGGSGGATSTSGSTRPAQQQRSGEGAARGSDERGSGRRASESHGDDRRNGSARGSGSRKETGSRDTVSSPRAGGAARSSEKSTHGSATKPLTPASSRSARSDTKAGRRSDGAEGRSPGARGSGDHGGAAAPAGGRAQREQEQQLSGSAKNVVSKPKLGIIVAGAITDATVMKALPRAATASSQGATAGTSSSSSRSVLEKWGFTTAADTAAAAAAASRTAAVEKTPATSTLQPTKIKDTSDGDAVRTGNGDASATVPAAAAETETQTLSPASTPASPAGGDAADSTAQSVAAAAEQQPHESSPIDASGIDSAVQECASEAGGGADGNSDDGSGSGKAGSVDTSAAPAEAPAATAPAATLPRAPVSAFLDAYSGYSAKVSGMNGGGGGGAGAWALPARSPPHPALSEALVTLRDYDMGGSGGGGGANAPSAALLMAQMVQRLAGRDGDGGGRSAGDSGSAATLPLAPQDAPQAPLPDALATTPKAPVVVCDSATADHDHAAPNSAAEPGHLSTGTPAITPAGDGGATSALTAPKAGDDDAGAPSPAAAKQLSAFTSAERCPSSCSSAPSTMSPAVRKPMPAAAFSTKVHRSLSTTFDDVAHGAGSSGGGGGVGSSGGGGIDSSAGGSSTGAERAADAAAAPGDQPSQANPAVPLAVAPSCPDADITAGASVSCDGGGGGGAAASALADAPESDSGSGAAAVNGGAPPVPALTAQQQTLSAGDAGGPQHSGGGGSSSASAWQQACEL